LQNAFREGVDIHALTAAQMFDVPLDQVSAELRQRAKAINFGIIYGISAFGLARQVGCSQGQAKDFITRYLERFPELDAFMEARREEARTNGFVRTLMGRKCLTPGIRDKNPNKRHFAERQAINAPLQGTAADIMKLAMIDLDRKIDAENIPAKLLLQVHDELLLEVPDSEVESVAAMVKKTMENAADLSIPLVAAAGWGRNWSDAH
ncbi:MAG: DNA polymerase, partial [Pseudomonadota bacterium]|nr:DNA polymerase [Pseudomonadota bacterium]